MWNILKDNIQQYTPKSLSSTRWESRLDSVKAIKVQMSQIREILLQVADVDNHGKIRSEAKSLAMNELGHFEFILAIVIWYEILSEINLVSNFLQSKGMLIDVVIEKIKGLISFFEGYRENGFTNAIIALKMDVDPVFPLTREIRRKKYFDENPETLSTPLSTEESLRIHYFLYVVDQAIDPLHRRFEQYQEYEKDYWFLVYCS